MRVRSHAAGVVVVFHGVQRSQRPLNDDADFGRLSYLVEGKQSSTLVSMKNKKPDNLSVIRKKFGVPARRGGVVRINGLSGIITGMSGDYVRVKLSGAAAGVPFHPNEIVYC